VRGWTRGPPGHPRRWPSWTALGVADRSPGRPDPCRAPTRYQRGRVAAVPVRVRKPRGARPARVCCRLGGVRPSAACYAASRSRWSRTASARSPVPPAGQAIAHTTSSPPSPAAIPERNDPARQPTPRPRQQPTTGTTRTHLTTLPRPWVGAFLNNAHALSRAGVEDWPGRGQEHIEARPQPRLCHLQS
jgi:hypothetical protein